MPNKVNLQSPPAFDDRQVYSFIWKLIEQLNVCLNQIDEDNLASDVREKLNHVFSVADEIDKNKQSSDGQVTQLNKATKSAITDTQSALQDSMNAIEQELSDSIEVNAAAIDALEERTDALEAIDLDALYATVDHTHNRFIDYLTEEQDTGVKWIDGSRIYQQSFAWTGSVSGDTITLGTIDGIGSVTGCTGFVKYDNTWSPINTFGKNSESYGYHIILEIPSTGKVNIHVGSQRTVKAATLTLQYTKA